MERGDFYSKALRRIFADYHGIEVGMYSYGCFNTNSIPAGTKIGRYCSFAAGVEIFNANHPLERLSMHPFFYNPRLKVIRQETIHRGCLTVGHDVWVGRNSMILPNVSNIGNGSVIGAGAVVTKDVPPYSVVGGNPARIIKYRFPESVQQAIEESYWWDYSIVELQKNLDIFLEPVSMTVLKRLKITP